MIQKVFRKYFTALTHLLFWTAFFIVSEPILDFLLARRPNVVHLLEILTILVIFYVNAYFFVPKFLEKRKYFKYITIVLISIFILSIGLSRIDYALKMDKLNKNITKIENRNSEQKIDKPPHNNFYAKQKMYEKRHKKHLRDIFLVLTTVFAISSIYSFVRINSKQEKELRALEKEQLTSELSFLKSQINPHFLFNVLNSIYSLTLKKSDDAPNAVLRLSDLLRYMTYESEKTTAEIEKEIAYIQNYIKLQKMRLAKNSKVNVEIFNNYPSARIAPLILITFVENAFKHGILANGTTNINIALKIQPKEIDFMVKNEYNELSQKDSVSGIGIQNVKRRLDIIYPNKHSLKIEKTENEHTVSLKINHA